MRAQRVAEEEIRAAVRAQGLADIQQIGAIVLETDGSFTVIGTVQEAPASSLTGVENYPLASILIDSLFTLKARSRPARYMP
jgi:uncharacterized membrane protein YcaP (DUF421 family)